MAADNEKSRKIVVLGFRAVGKKKGYKGAMTAISTYI
jgi:hypothetical protein